MDAGNGGAIILILSILYFMSSSAMFKTTLDVHKRYTTRTELVANIVSLRTQDKLSGSFLLGTGSIKDEEYYYMMEANPSGSYTRFKIKTKGVEILERKDCKPHVERIYRVYDKFWYLGKRVSRTIIIVPPNTFVKQFQIK